MDALGPRLGAFRTSFGVVWPLSGFLAFALFPLVIRQIVTADSPSLLMAVAALSSLLLVPLLLVVFLAPLIWIYQIRVHELGLRGFTASGRFVSARWSTLLEVSPVGIPGMRYLRVRTTEIGVELYLPRDLDDSEKFAQLVASAAGPLNPLSRFLESDLA